MVYTLTRHYDRRTQYEADIFVSFCITLSVF